MFSAIAGSYYYGLSYVHRSYVHRPKVQQIYTRNGINNFSLEISRLARL